MPLTPGQQATLRTFGHGLDEKAEDLTGLFSVGIHELVISNVPLTHGVFRAPVTTGGIQSPDTPSARRPLPS